MIYRFQIETTKGLIESIIETDTDFSTSPFGYVPYRGWCSCECSQEVLDDFWNSVDKVLADNNLTSDDFIRAVRAYVGDRLIGEYA